MELLEAALQEAESRLEPVSAGEPLEGSTQEPELGQQLEASRLAAEQAQGLFGQEESTLEDLAAAELRQGTEATLEH